MQLCIIKPSQIIHHLKPLLQCLTTVIKSNPTVKKSLRPQKGHCEKRCEIQGGGQEMAVMVG